MKHEIDKIVKNVKEGIYTREDAQKMICEECLLHPSWECKKPCYLKKFSQLSKSKYTELPIQRQYHGVKLVINPDNLEIIQKAQLDNIMIATIEPNHLTERGHWENRRSSRYFPSERKRKWFYPVLGDGQLWIQHLSYKIGSEESKRIVNT